MAPMTGTTPSRKTEPTDSGEVPGKTTPRYVFLDFYRGGVLIAMMVYHFYIYFYNRLVGPAEVFLFEMGKLVAPVFLLISGFSFNYFLHAREGKGRPETAWREVVVRGALIFFISTGLNLVFGGSVAQDTSFQHWTIFKLIGLSMIVVYFLNRAAKGPLLLGGFIILVFILGAVYDITQTPVLWFFADGLFAFFPWAAFYITGFLVGNGLVVHDEKGVDTSRLARIQAGAVPLFAVTAFIFHAFDPDEYWTRNLVRLGENVSLFLILLLLSFYISRRLADTRLEILPDIGRGFGRTSFSIYYIHFGIIYAFNLADRLLFADFFVTHMGLGLYAGITAGLLGALVVFERVWKKVKYKGGLEWIIRELSRVIVKPEKEHVSETKNKETNPAR